jgi:alkanesulfonate monooxygenase SsuD/methylene tetrahydromethanopterin reductase-like flavin-dependent oxidoreductase (luciferase family)
LEYRCSVIELAYFIHRADPVEFERVRFVESLGYSKCFVTTLAGRDALTMAGAYGAATSRIGVGSGITPIYTRTPAAMAQTAATLDEVTGGRFTLGLGVSQRELVQAWHGATIEDPVREMREYVAIVRAILRGEDPPPGERWQTYFRLAGMEPRPDLPIYLAALSPAMLRLAGEVADGVILWLANEDYIRDVALPALAEGRERAGRSMDDFVVSLGIFAAVDEDGRGSSYALMRRMLRSYFGAPFYRKLLAREGYGDEVAAFDAAGGDADAQRAAISDRFLEEVTLSGGAAEVRERVERLGAAGVTLPFIRPTGSEEAHLENTLRTVASAAGIEQPAGSLA